MSAIVVRWVPVLLLLTACGEKDDDEGGECTSTLGTVSGQVLTDYLCDATASDARLEFSQEEEELPLMIRPDETGAYAVDLEAGAWEVSGFGHADTCITEEPVSITVEACQVLSLDVCADLCVDG